MDQEQTALWRPWHHWLHQCCLVQQALQAQDPLADPPSLCAANPAMRVGNPVEAEMDPAPVRAGTTNHTALSPPAFGDRSSGTPSRAIGTTRGHGVGRFGAERSGIEEQLSRLNA